MLNGVFQKRKYNVSTGGAVGIYQEIKKATSRIKRRKTGMKLTFAGPRAHVPAARKSRNFGERFSEALR